MNLSSRDQALIWHPFTQAKTANPPLAIMKGEGAYVYDENGNKLLDLISSWWVNLHGHGHPYIAQKIYEQALQLEHFIFANFTHQPAVELCEGLQKILPDDLTKFFFSDNGSTAVEIALKIAYQFWKNQGEKNRTIYLSFEGAYHGDTFGAMAAGKSSGFHTIFQDLFFDVKTIPFPATWEGDQDINDKEEKALEILSKYLQEFSHKTVAFIAEPLIQGANGMRMCRPSFLNKVIEILRNDNILIILDEVMTGFGRTGTFFAFDQCTFVPDILCVSKGLTGGFLPLALTIVKDHIYQAFLGDTFEKAFSHGHSYTANPLGCAAAIASLELLQQPSTQTRIKNIVKVHKNGLQYLSENIPSLKSVRQMGIITAFNLYHSDINYTNSISAVLAKRFLEEGLILRPLGNVVYLLPPYCIDLETLSNVYTKIEKILKEFHF